MEKAINTLENGWKAVANDNLPAFGTIATPQPISLTGSVPTPPDLGYYSAPTSRCPVQTPDLSTTDNLRQFYRNGGSFRRFWPKQAKS